MAYPNFKNKHVEEAFFGPADSSKKFKSPKKNIIIYDRKLFTRIILKYKPIKIHDSMTFNLYTYENIGLVLMKGIGSPHAVMVF